MKELKFTILSDITLDLLLRELTAEGDISIEKNYFDAILPCILSHRNELLQSSNIFIHCESYFLRHGIDYQMDLFETIYQFAQEYSGQILLSNIEFSHPRSNLKNSPKEGYNKDLTQVLVKLRRLPNLFFVDTEKCIEELGRKHVYNYSLGHLYQMPYTIEFMSLYSKEIRSVLTVVSNADKKVLAIDCDNTLWGGILGEDGLEGIRVNRNSDGILYLHFHEFLLEKKKEGFLLCLCSKNNEGDVQKAFDEMEMPLKWEDFVAKKINWKNKSDNLLEISRELSLGLESFVFVDDSEFEINAVKEALPEVSTVHFEEDYEKFLKLVDSPLFKKKDISESDLKKSEQYEQEFQRAEQKKSMSFEAYLSSLNIKLSFGYNDSTQLSRLAQMTEKTNQFNFNKEVFSEKDLLTYIEKGHHAISLAVTDKFGDYGVIGLALLKSTGVLENLIMSCRALGRNIENDFAKEIKNYAAKKNISINRISFKVTERNKPAELFLPTLKNILELKE